MGPQQLSLDFEAFGKPLDVVRAHAEAAARQRGATLVRSGLRLFASPVSAPAVASLLAGADSLMSPFGLGRTYELLLAPATRRRTGAHLTPELIARRLVAIAPKPEPNATVLDPAVGGGSFLLAAADQLVQVGGQAHQVLDQLLGFDLDPAAVEVAEAALALWALDQGVEPRPLAGLQVGDGLLTTFPAVDRVVSNPPFLNQLRSASSSSAIRRQALRERWGDLVGAYTDDAWLFLAASVAALREGGVAAMIQPLSVLAARHAGPARRRIAEQAELRAIWVAAEPVFDAAVQVCAIVVSQRPGPASAAVDPPVRMFHGAAFTPGADANPAPTCDEWGVAAAAMIGVPHVMLRRTRRLGDLADATAGFRDQFYGLVPFVSEHDATTADGDLNHPKLVTVGMIDPFELGWGDRLHTFAGRKLLRPVLDVAALEETDPRLGEWVRARQRPKLLMATQTRIVELWIDAGGEAIPATPVISIEPRNCDDLWHLAAALSAPALSAHLVAANFGTAMSLHAMKVAARDLLDAPLPVQGRAWTDAATLIEQRLSMERTRDLFDDFGRLMGLAYGTTSVELLRWWFERLPNRWEPR